MKKAIWRRNYESKKQKDVFEKEDGALEAFRRYLELDEKSEATIRKYMHDVKVFLTFQKGKRLLPEGADHWI